MTCVSRRAFLQKLFSRQTVGNICLLLGLYSISFLLLFLLSGGLLLLLVGDNLEPEFGAVELLQLPLWIATIGALFGMYKGYVAVQNPKGRWRRYTKLAVIFIVIFTLSFLPLLFVTRGDIDRFFLQWYFNGDCRNFLSLTYSFRTLMLYPLAILVSGVLTALVTVRIRWGFFLRFIGLSVLFFVLDMYLFNEAAFTLYHTLIAPELQGSQQFIAFMRIAFLVVFPVSVVAALLLACEKYWT